MTAVLGLAPRLQEAAAAVRVDPVAPRAVVAGEPVDAADDRALHLAVCAAVYRRLHAGLAGGSGRAAQRAQQRRDLDREQVLTAALPHRSRPVPVRVLERHGPYAVVQVDGLRVWVAATALSGAGELELPATRPNLSPGFLLADGSRGGVDAGPDLLRVYANVPSPDAGLRLWRAAARTLEDHAVPYRMKTTSAVTDIARRDGLVVYLGPAAWPALDALVGALAATGAAGPDTSVFTRTLAPGVAAAYEPRDPRPAMRGLSFGQHRSLILTDALLSPECRSGARDPAAAVHDAMVAAGVDPRHPHRALDGPAAPV